MSAVARPLTFTLVGRIDSQGVAIEPVLATITEEAVSVVDALQALSCLPVAVANSIGIDVVTAFTGTTGSDRPALTQRVSKETIITELAAFPWTEEQKYVRLEVAQNIIKKHGG